MKYQHMAIIFVLIVLPISVVLSFYIKNQSDTLELETKYQSKLNDSTYDAIAAYQINSLNTQRVRGESVKSYVLASVNTFFTTLATNFGMSSASKQNLQPYVPAILFTTYDGYYIYSPTQTYNVAEDPETGIALMDDEKNILYIENGANSSSDIDYEHSATYRTSVENEKNDINAVPKDYSSVPHVVSDTDNAEVQYNYMLKPFIYYSARYSQGNNYDFIASYTLDNYVTLYGTKRTNRDSGTFVVDEFTKSGYLINPTKIELTGNILVKTNKQRNGQSAPDPSNDPNQTGRNKYEKVLNVNNDPSNPNRNNVKYHTIDINSVDAYNYINYYSFNDGSLSEFSYPGGYYPYQQFLNGNRIRYQTGDEIIEDTLNIEELGASTNINSLIDGGIFWRNKCYI